MKQLIGSFIIMIFLSCGVSDNAQVFDGTWIDTKNPENVWKFEASPSGVTGSLISGDKSMGATGSWKISSKNGLIIGTSAQKDGASLTYFPNRDEIMRTPPGILYKRKK